MKVYQCLANVAVVLNNRHSTMPQLDYQTQMLDKLLKLAPSGSGFDAGTEFNHFVSRDNLLIFETEFHHMNEDGYYVGWTKHRVNVTASLIHGISIKVTGEDRNGIKDFIAETFHDFLTAEYEG